MDDVLDFEYDETRSDNADRFAVAMTVSAFPLLIVNLSIFSTKGAGIKRLAKCMEFHGHFAFGGKGITLRQIEFCAKARGFDEASTKELMEGLKNELKELGSELI